MVGDVTVEQQTIADGCDNCAARKGGEVAEDICFKCGADLVRGAGSCPSCGATLARRETSSGGTNVNVLRIAGYLCATIIFIVVLYAVWARVTG